MIKYTILEDKSIEFKIYDEDPNSKILFGQCVFIIKGNQLLELQGKIRDACFDFVKSTGLKLDAKSICEDKDGCK